MENETVVILSRIRNYIIEHFPLARKKAAINDDSLLLDNGIIDSLGFLDLICFLEEEFKIQISDEEVLPENFESIKIMSVFVQSKSSRQATLLK